MKKSFYLFVNGLERKETRQSLIVFKMVTFAPILYVDQTKKLLKLLKRKIPSFEIRRITDLFNFQTIEKNTLKMDKKKFDVTTSITNRTILYVVNVKNWVDFIRHTWCVFCEIMRKELTNLFSSRCEIRDRKNTYEVLTNNKAFIHGIFNSKIIKWFLHRLTYSHRTGLVEIPSFCLYTAL